MKIIFLDIDGVLNCQDYYVNGRVDKPYPLSEFCPDRIELLNSIISETGAKVVISSSWRIGRTQNEISNILSSAGFKGEIIGITPSCKCGLCMRGNEIHQWIRTNKELIGRNYHQYKSFVILDDDSDMLLWQSDNFFRCDTYSGLTPDITYMVINFFKSF